MKLLNNPDNAFSLIRREYNVYFLAVDRVPPRPRVFSLTLRVIDHSGLASQLSFQVRASRSTDPEPSPGGQGGEDGSGGAVAFTTRYYTTTLADTVVLKPGGAVISNLGLHWDKKRTDVQFASSDPRFAVNSTSLGGKGQLVVTQQWRGQQCSPVEAIVFTLTATWRVDDEESRMRDNCTVTLNWFPVKNTQPRFRVSTFHEMPPLDYHVQLGTCFDLPVSDLVLCCNVSLLCNGCMLCNGKIELRMHASKLYSNWDAFRLV